MKRKLTVLGSVVGIAALPVVAHLLPLGLLLSIRSNM